MYNLIHQLECIFKGKLMVWVNLINEFYVKIMHYIASNFRTVCHICWWLFRDRENGE